MNGYATCLNVTDRMQYIIKHHQQSDLFLDDDGRVNKIRLVYKPRNQTTETLTIQFFDFLRYASRWATRAKIDLHIKDTILGTTMHSVIEVKCYEFHFYYGVGAIDETIPLNRVYIGDNDMILTILEQFNFMIEVQS